ncbi:toll/interleukin-1 receptor domain-containing protein [Adhaeribacter radiodurans]|uniref:Toll/interleukin-1 receptor domain-containing protein n=1 Tax=Adhaeribacter radiodurans TaxID=2745197 RepID=A0A7L7L4Z0_9BACT|nr:toll/interleukin-1 receptor domain-containing protein [Adhaeribacter radiodurans]QMU27834.1 toll/interleukin-1 receptor domain-containing protein [Adhaeribacter radiodurans]
MNRIKVFLASSIELKEDRKEFEIFINRKNNSWSNKGMYLELMIWEDFLDSLSQTRLQDEYNKAIKVCDIFVMLFHSKVGKYTQEEFEIALSEFSKKGKPIIFTYFKDIPTTENSNENDAISLRVFQERLKQLGHFPPTYKNNEGLREHFNKQLDKLSENGFIELQTQASNKKGIKVTIANSKNVNTGNISAGGNISFGDNTTNNI